MNATPRLWLSHLAVAVRALRRDPVGSAINIVSLALGMAACLLVLLYARYELSYDRFWPDANRIVKLTIASNPPGQPAEINGTTPGVAVPHILQDLPQVQAATRMIPRTLRVMYRNESGERRENPQSWFIDPAFFQIFPLEFVAGRPDTALVDRHSLILVEPTAVAWFGSTNVIGREVEVELPGGGTWVARVSGVVRDLPSNSHLRLHNVLMLYSTEVFDFQRAAHQTWRFGWSRSFLKLAPEASIDVLNRDLRALVERHVPPTEMRGEARLRDLITLGARPLAGLHLDSALADGLMRPSGSGEQVAIMVAVALAVLLIAAANFLNLSLAQASLRQREVALRKVIGAGRGEVALQFLLQSLLAAGLGVLAALALAELLLPYFQEFLDRPVPAAGPWTATAAALLVLLLGLGAGALPALRMAAVRPGEALHANRSVTTAGGTRLRTVLVVVQFVLAIGMLIALLVSKQQFRHLQAAERNIDTDHVVTLWGLRWPEVQEGMQAFMQEVRSLPDVQAVSASDVVPANAWAEFGTADEVMTRLADRPDGATTVLTMMPASASFFDVYRIALVAGRYLGVEHELDAAHGLTSAQMAQRGVNVLIDEAAVRSLGLAQPADALGKTLTVSLGNPPNRVPATIVGVVRAARFGGLTDVEGPKLYLQQRNWYLHFSVRAAPGTLRAVIPEVQAIWNRMFPRVAFLPTVSAEKLARDARWQQRPSQAFAVAALIAMVLSAVGMYALAAFAAQRQAREIALRRLMGASVAQVAGLLLWRLTRPLLAAALIACPLAWWALSHWLAEYPSRTDLTPAPFILALVAAIALTWAVTASRVFVAARRRPIEDLRHE
jgi:putative ABC transport system permease protein